MGDIPLTLTLGKVSLTSVLGLASFLTSGFLGARAGDVVAVLGDVSCFFCSFLIFCVTVVSLSIEASKNEIPKMNEKTFN